METPFKEDISARIDTLEFGSTIFEDCGYEYFLRKDMVGDIIEFFCRRRNIRTSKFTECFVYPEGVNKFYTDYKGNKLNPPRDLGVIYGNYSFQNLKTFPV